MRIFGGSCGGVEDEEEDETMGRRRGLGEEWGEEG